MFRPTPTRHLGNRDALHERRSHDIAPSLRLPGVPSWSRGGDRVAARRAIGAGGLPHGGGQEPLLPVAGALVRRPDGGRLAVDRPDEGPGGRPGEEGRGRRATGFEPDRPRGPRRTRRTARRPAENPLRLARAARRRAAGGDLGAPGRRLARDRRGALHQRVGPQLPSRILEARGPRGTTPSGTSARPHRHRDARGRAGHRAVARGRRRRRRDHRLPPPEPGTARHPVPRRGAPRPPPQPPPRPSSRRFSGLCDSATHGRSGRRGARGRRPGRPSVPRGARRRRSARRPGLVHGVENGGRRRDDRFRHGDRQARHPRRLSSEFAEDPGELRPGGRSRGPRRRAVVLRGLRVGG